MNSLARFVLAFAAGLSIVGCASWQRDPLQVTVAGIEPLQGQGMELRMNVRLRVQNPNDAPLDYDGVALEMDVQGKTFATGVAAAAGTVPRFGETVITVPVTISAFRMARQAIGAISGGELRRIEYEMKGKFGGGTLGGRRFVTRGSFEFPNDRNASP
nr:hypothetical protein [uncultured bacterium]